MKLFGVGTDIIQVNRLKKSLNKKPFLSRIYSQEEILKWPDLEFLQSV